MTDNTKLDILAIASQLDFEGQWLGRWPTRAELERTHYDMRELMQAMELVLEESKP
jgi:hypothetical protein